MALFQNSVLKDHLRIQDEQQVNEAYNRLTAFFHNPEIQENIRSSKEEQFQATFLNELFVKVLDYTMNPQPGYELTTEFKNQKNARKADGAILKDGRAIGVIELKGTNTKHLEGIRQQAFDYKANQKGCVYVITSNFEKLRFYINDATEFLEFDLFELNREDFSLLYLCLHKDNIFSNRPLKIKEASLEEEEVITRLFYKDYSVFKRELFRDLVLRNVDRIKKENLSDRHPELACPDRSGRGSGSNFEAETKKQIRLSLFKKSQKLIDRFLFIFFAEDRGLLPPNSIHKILADWNKLKDLDAVMPLYDRFKQYFGFLDTGRKGTDKKAEIFAYNGGLFKPDPILDMLVIDDELLYKHTSQLARYDFESQVDVNILGHIFENSLNEIEEIENKILEESDDNSSPAGRPGGTSKRKKDGVFYTPKYITKYIVENTVGRLCEEKKSELGFREEEYYRGRKQRQTKTVKGLIEILDDYREWLLKLTICDPACGSGAFLNHALDFLIREHRYIDEMKAKLLGGSLLFSDIETTILENNIYGVDINEESVEIAKLSLWLRTAQPRRKLNDLSSNIKCGNSLIDDPKVAGNKAFTWEEQFPDVFSKGGFDVVIGNPPYVFARDNFSAQEKEFFSKKYESAKYQINTYLLFIEKTIQILNSGGQYGLIVPNAWLMVYSGEGIRKVLLEKNNIEQIINLSGYSFEGVNVETIILIAQNNRSSENEIEIYLNNGKEFLLSHKRKQQDFSKNEGLEFRVFSDEKSLSLTNKLKENSVILDLLVDIKAGLQAYEKNKGTPKQSAADVKNRPYDYDYKFDDDTFKYLEGKDVGRYSISWSGLYLRYGEHLAAPRTFDLFEGEKIIVREITGKYPKSLIATYSDETYLYNRSNIAIVEKENKQVSLKYILALLNSTLLSYWFIKNTAKSVRKMFPKIILNDLRKFPFKDLNEEEQMPFIIKVEKMLRKKAELQRISGKFMNYFVQKFSLQSPKRKLQEWAELEFGDFIKELNKAIKVSNKERAKEGLSPVAEPTKKDEFEWMELFEENKQKALELQREIEKTDKDIDKMVYELYGLTEEEIAIVEGSSK